MSEIQRYGNDATGQGGKALPFSTAVRAGDFIYISGQVAFNEGGVLEYGDIEIQTRVTMDNVVKALKLADCNLEDVIKINVWLDDPRDFWGFNKIYATYFTPGKFPARSCVRSEIMIDAKIEIDAIAYKPLRK